METAKLTSQVAGGTFGECVALSGDTALIGVPRDSALAPAAGSARVFVKSAGTWTLQATLQSMNPAIFEVFGRGVALDGDRAVIGARGLSVPGLGAHDPLEAEDSAG